MIKKKMQDIVGVRIVLYFIDDVDIVYELLKFLPNYIEESNSNKDIQVLDEHTDLKIGKLSDKIFMPQRLNLIFKMSDVQTDNLEMALANYKYADLIDNTYEVQIRTIFSEGWHEVEHDLRYKCQNDQMWNYCKEESRTLNGIYASLETTESSMRSLFDKIAYKNFKHQDWAAMLRNKLCIRFDDNTLSDGISKLLDSNKDVLGKELFKYQRTDLFSAIQSLPRSIPKKMDNIVFLINRLTVRNQEMIQLEPKPISELLNQL